MALLVEKDIMQTSQTGIYKSVTRYALRVTEKKGFTIIELLLVIFIISLVMSAVMPSFWHIGENELKYEARRLSGTLRYIYDEAVAKKQAYIFKVNLNDDSWEFEGDKEKKEIFLKGDVEITDVIIPSLGEVSRGEVIVEFGPTNPQEPITLHLKKGNSEYTVIFNHLNGRTKVLKGYVL